MTNKQVIVFGLWTAFDHVRSSLLKQKEQQRLDKLRGITTKLESNPLMLEFLKKAKALILFLKDEKIEDIGDFEPEC